MEAEQRTAGKASTSGSTPKDSSDKPIVVLVIGKLQAKFSST
jgi:hypothetical protein